MLHIDLDKLDVHVAAIRTLLKEGLISLDIWDRENSLGLSSYQRKPEIAELMNDLLEKVDTVLDGSSMAGVGRFLFIPLQSSQTLLMIKHDGGILEAMLLDASNVNIGMVFSVIVPKSLEDIRLAKTIA